MSDFQLGRWERYNYDQDAGRLTFSSGGRIEVIADIQIVGSTSSSTGTWLWSWDNDTILPRVRHCIEEVRALGEKRGFPKLTVEKWEGDEYDGWEMTAIAAYVLKADGAYRSPGSNGALFMILKNVRWANPSGAGRCTP